MKNYNLYEIFQNTALSSIALHSFILGYYKVAKKYEDDITNYPQMTFLFYVLPIIYNDEAMRVFHSSNHLYTAICSDDTIILGLADRANKMSTQTFDALNLGFSKKIFAYNNKNKTIELNRGFRSKKLTLPLSMKNKNHNMNMIIQSAFKLGGVFAKTNKKNLQINLNIVF